MNCEQCGQPTTLVIITDLESGQALETQACWNPDCVDYDLPLPEETQSEMENQLPE